jgi:hypothetical protein
LTEATPEIYKVVDDKGEEQGEITLDEIMTINRSRGVVKERSGFSISHENITEQEFNNFNVKNYIVYKLPLPIYEWEKWKGRIKKIKWKNLDIHTEIYYNPTENITYVYKLKKKIITKYFYTETLPTDQEILDFSIIQSEYIQFLKDNSMEIETTSQDMVNAFKVIDRWTDSDKVDVFSRITPEQRENIVMSRWIGAVTWFPPIFEHIKGFLRLGQSVEEPGRFGRGGKKPLIDIQGDTLGKLYRGTEEEQQGAWGGKEQ